MKKFILMPMLAVLAVFMLGGCSEPAEYNQVEGRLEELDTRLVSMQTADGQALCFQLAPETLVYKGEGKDLVPGDEITVVFEGNLDGTDTKGVSVITVSAAP